VLPSRPMDAQRALADLTEISSQVRAAVIAGPDGEVLASTVPEERARSLAEKAAALVAAAPFANGRELTHLQAATRDGSLFVVRDGQHLIAATSGATPTVGLVFYDLKTCLRALRGNDEAKPKRRSRKKAGDAAA
jgi:predicted regulator of Ras-like GTPase activity (Roadblock/LC7/MglB family)